MKNTAILLLHAPDDDGIVPGVTEFVLNNKGKIKKLDQHVMEDNKQIFMRIEWLLTDFAIPKDKIGEFFDTLLAKKYGMKWSLHFSDKKTRVALFVSKYAHCLHDILSRFESIEWDIEIPVIISNHDKFRYVAERYNIPYHHLPITKENKKEQEAKELAILKEHNIDLIVLARYMQILTNEFIDQYPNKIINIHHSSLPAFAGADPYGSAFKRGVKFMGATAHYATEDLDEGPIIVQDVIPISHRDSIKDMKRKGKDIEKQVLSEAVWAHLNYNVLTYKNKTVVFQ